jgi:Cu/Ag efflux pump CusA
MKPDGISHDRATDPLVDGEPVLRAARIGVPGRWGVYSCSTPIDALPDLSDVQVIIRTTWNAIAADRRDQVTYPLTTTMLSVPGAKAVRGYSFFGDSFVYVLFEDGTDLYWARSRVLEYLNQVQSRLPAGAHRPGPMRRSRLGVRIRPRRSQRPA